MAIGIRIPDLPEPARTVLAVLGVAAVGALLFDMLLLSRGLVLSMQEMLDTITAVSLTYRFF